MCIMMYTFDVYIPLTRNWASAQLLVFVFQLFWLKFTYLSCSFRRVEDNIILYSMTNTNNSSKLNATVINIHSPNDEVHTPDLDFHRRPSAHSNASRQTPLKPSPKVEEYRKMIQHIIGKILKRKRPPTALFHLSEYCRTTQVTDQFDNDDTIDLLIQLRSALLVCHSVGLSTQVLIQR